MHKPFFITGMLRSGTTLLQQVLSTLPEIKCSYQALTPLFIDEKKAFLAQKNLTSPFPLSNYFPPQHTSEEFTIYLDYISFYKKYNLYIGQERQGDKEVLCEEFLPHLVKKIKTIIIIRDPRDVIASIHFGDGSKYTGLSRPLLFDLRNWRKSFAFAALLVKNPNFLLIKYEDLVGNFKKIYSELLKFIETKPDEPENLVLQALFGNLSGNSSFFKNIKGISPSSIGISKKVVPQLILDNIETFCFPEMEALGYEVNPKNRFDYMKIQSFKEPFIIKRPQFSGLNYEKELDREIQRLKLLESPKNSYSKSYFIFEEVYKILKAGQRLI